MLTETPLHPLASYLATVWAVVAAQVPRLPDGIYGPNELRGSASCAAAACHGGLDAGRSQFRTWFEQDRHAEAYRSLLGERSQSIARRAGIDSPERNPRCLGCHSTLAVRRRPAPFDVREGVSCESCHGAAEKWLEPHKAPSWRNVSPATKHQELGMTETKNVLVRVMVCVQCHVGAAERDVDHELIAAGHPALIFELDLFTARLPPHWVERPPNDSPLFGAAQWAIGQAAVTKQSLTLLQARLRGGAWPEFAEFDCTACHHGLSEPSWRQARGYRTRTPGALLWLNPSRTLIAPLVDKDTAAATKPGALEALAEALSAARPSDRQLTTLVRSAEDAAAGVLVRVAGQPWDKARVRALLAELSAHRELESFEPVTAMHLTLAIGALFESLERARAANGRASPERSTRVWQAVNRLLDATQDPMAYSPQYFARDLRELRSLWLEPN